MNLVGGEVLETRECEAVLDNVEQRILETLSKGRLHPETVIAACDKLVASMDVTKYLTAMAELGIDEALGKQYIEEARQLFCADSLRHRLRVELGDSQLDAKTIYPPYKDYTVTEQVLPLGVLLHIAAGNADGLPAFSVLEGLLTGNINILKLPSVDGGLSIRLLLELIEVEPALADYIYVFDYSSKDIVHMRQLIEAADAVVIWGGKEAVSALRMLVPPHVRLIEWGHKISFAYVTKQGMTEDGLRGLAMNMAVTGQLLCSSLQGIYFDTEDEQDVHTFCRRFLPILDDVLRQNSKSLGIGIRSQISLKLYNEELEGIYKNSKVFKGEYGSVIAYTDSQLETAIQFGNTWVRPLPQERLREVLHPYKNFLQTAALLCGDSEREQLCTALFQTGVVRICPGEIMSTTYAGAPHDGEYPLRRYTKIVSLCTNESTSG